MSLLVDNCMSTRKLWKCLDICSLLCGTKSCEAYFGISIQSIQPVCNRHKQSTRNDYLNWCVVTSLIEHIPNVEFSKKVPLLYTYILIRFIYYYHVQIRLHEMLLSKVCNMHEFYNQYTVQINVNVSSLMTCTAKTAPVPILLCSALLANWTTLQNLEV